MTVCHTFMPLQFQVQQLRDWLASWHAAHGERGGVPAAKKKGRGAGGSSSRAGEGWGGGAADKKAVLLSGGPGIGKTTTAKLVCAELGFTPLEVGR